VKPVKSLCFAAVLACGFAAPAHADEVFGGLYVHDVKTPLDLSGVENGLDAQLGWRSDPHTRLKLQEYFFVAINTAGKTHYAALGFSRKFGDRIYVRPGLGMAIHTGSPNHHNIPGNDRIEFGSQVLFEPELAVGTRLNDRTSIEASWIHMSHAQLFSGQNPGIDNLGVRLNYRFK
jgi:lipid A 3-O-deacylase